LTSRCEGNTLHHSRIKSGGGGGAITKTSKKKKFERRGGGVYGGKKIQLNEGGKKSPTRKNRSWRESQRPSTQERLLEKKSFKGGKYKWNEGTARRRHNKRGMGKKDTAWLGTDRSNWTH